MYICRNFQNDRAMIDERLHLYGAPTHPGDLITDELEERGMTVSELAAKSKLPVALLSDVIAGRKDVDIDIAMALKNALGIDADYWLRLQESYYEEVEYQAAQKKSKIKEWLKATVIPNG